MPLHENRYACRFRLASSRQSIYTGIATALPGRPATLQGTAKRTCNVRMVRVTHRTSLTTISRPGIPRQTNGTTQLNLHHTWNSGLPRSRRQSARSLAIRLHAI